MVGPWPNQPHPPPRSLCYPLLNFSNDQEVHFKDTPVSEFLSDKRKSKRFFS